MTMIVTMRVSTIKVLSTRQRTGKREREGGRGGGGQGGVNVQKIKGRQGEGALLEVSMKESSRSILKKSEGKYSHFTVSVISLSLMMQLCGHE